MEAIIYSLVFVFFLGLSFFILRAVRIERAFEQNHVFEIRAAYLILSIISAFLMCEFIWKLLTLSGVNL